MAEQMIHPISLSAIYLQTFVITMDGKHKLRSHATGLFVRDGDSMLLLTNWHVVSGLDPADPTMQHGKPSPHYLKAIVPRHNRQVSTLWLPLYDKEMKPIWFEHPSGSGVDLAFIHLPRALQDHFLFYDIHSVEDKAEIEEIVGRDVFVVGYPFSKEELREGFGQEVMYYLPTWKRGSIASEPTQKLGGRVILIDTLSRPGMSGAPVFTAYDSEGVMPTSLAAAESMKQLMSGKGPPGMHVLNLLDTSQMRTVRRKRFRFLGIYSGTIGKTKLAEVALGKCWHADVVQETIKLHRFGEMPYHSPIENEHYTSFLARFESGVFVIRNKDGDEEIRVQL